MVKRPNTPKSYCYAALRCDASLFVNHVSSCFSFSDIHISQGSVAERLRCGGIFYFRSARDLLLSPSVKKLKIDQHLRKLNAKMELHFFRETV